MCSRQDVSLLGNRRFFLQKLYTFHTFRCSRFYEVITSLLTQSFLHGKTSVFPTPFLFDSWLTQKTFRFLCSRQESNLDHQLRRPVFYPLNYKSSREKLTQIFFKIHLNKKHLVRCFLFLSLLYHC